MKTRTILSVIVVMIFGFLLTGCQQDDNEPKIEQEQITGQYDAKIYELSKDPEIQAELQFMKNYMGVNPAHVYIGKGKSLGQYGIFVPGDWDGIVIDREEIQLKMKQNDNSENNNISARHRRSSIMATSGPKDIRYLSSVPSEWKTAINAGRLEWNNLGKSLKFNTPTNGSSSTGKINVSFESFAARNFPSDAIALGRTPSNSHPNIGMELVINTDVANTLNPSQKKFVMAHELGHNIGFYHTDTYSGFAVTTTNYACSNSTDTSSIMRNGLLSSIVPSWPSSGFTSCDKDAFDWFY